MNWYEVTNIHDIDSPALLVYPERIKENIRKAIEMAGDAGLLRPHVKTNKMREVCRLMMDAGIHSFKCATIAEAEMLAMTGAADVLLAHQPVGPKIARFRSLVTTYPNTRFSCIIDNIGIARQIDASFKEIQQTAQLYIDVNNGMKRSGIQPDKALLLFGECMQLKNIQVKGIHVYDGHVKNTDPATRSQESDTAFAHITRLLAGIATLSPSQLQVVVGGSPSFPTHTKRKDVQYSPGTFVFWDWGYAQELPDEPFTYAALVITRVISILDDHTICADLGHKAVAAENPLPRVTFLNAPDAVPAGHSEEHLVINVPDASVYQPGDVLYGVPFHICPTVALHDDAMVIENNRFVASWKVIARSRKITI